MPVNTTVKDLCSKTIIKSTTSDTLESAIEKIYLNRIHQIIIEEEDGSLSVLPLNSILDYIFSNKDKNELISDVPRNSLKIVLDTTLLTEVLIEASFDENAFGIVNSENELYGVLTYYDLINHIKQDDIKNISKFTVETAISKDNSSVVMVGEKLTNHINQLQTSFTDSIIILNNNHKAIGIITKRDIVRHYTNGSNLIGNVEDFMTKPLFTLKSNINIVVALNHMQNKNFRRAIIEDDSGCYLGVITQKSLIGFVYNKLSSNMNSVNEVRNQSLMNSFKSKLEEAQESNKVLKKVSDELNKKNELLQEIQNVAHLGSWELDITSNKLTWSDEVYNIFGIDTKDFKATYEIFLSYIHPDDLERVKETYKNSIDKKLDYETTHRIVRDDESIRYVNERCKHYYDTSGNIVKSIGTVHDITEIKLQEKQLFKHTRQAQMGEMISMIAHQWRQPLSAISSIAIDLKMKSEFKNFDLEKKEEAQKYEKYVNNAIGNINEFVQSLTHTIDDFRSFFKPDREADYTLFDEPINKALNIIKSSILSENIEIVRVCTNCNKSIKMYSHEIMQVILNILKNSQDNFKEKNINNPKITIICECSTNNKPILKICDNGGGIPEDVIDKIFDPYFSTKDEKNGTGLGLHMSKVIIEEHHNGKLSVNNIDEGVCFRIEI